MNTQDWLTLMEYSNRYRVSLSTLRRRIKAGDIDYRFADGKYLIKDGPLQVSQPASGQEAIAPPTSVRPRPEPVVEEVESKMTSASNDRFWKSTQSLLQEIKKAYSLILQEKEEQILQLKEEVADLKTLVRVLEDSNEQLKEANSSSSMLNSSSDFLLDI